MSYLGWKKSLKKGILPLCILGVLLVGLYTAFKPRSAAYIASPYSIVFVHIGPALPDYLQTAVSQAHLFNEQCPIFVIANKKALNKLPADYFAPNTHLVTCESLTKSVYHKRFIENSTVDKKFWRGFWSHATERLFYLDDFVTKNKLKNVFHLENDVMLYANLEDELPVFQQHYPGMIGATFDSDKRCIAGLIYVAEAEPLSRLAEFISLKCHLGGTDMEFLSQFRDEYQAKFIDYLPIIMPAYAQDFPLQNQLGEKAVHQEPYFKNVESFKSLFDAAAMGQYLGGGDPRVQDAPPGFINEKCFFNPALLQFAWQADAQGRQVPYAVYKNEQWRINNLHIHCKNLAKFHSHNVNK